MEKGPEKWVCAHCGYTADGKFVEDICPQCRQKNILLPFYEALKSFGTTFPMLLGVILVLGRFRGFVSNQMISAVFTGDLLRDTIIGSVVGSISAGNAVTSHIIGGELIKEKNPEISKGQRKYAHSDTPRLISYCPSYGDYELFC